MSDNGERYVTWKEFLAIILPVLVTPIIVTWLLIQSHTGTPHKGSLTERDYKIILDDLHEVKTEIHELRKALMNGPRRN